MILKLAFLHLNSMWWFGMELSLTKHEFSLPVKLSYLLLLFSLLNFILLLFWIQAIESDSI